MEKIELNINNKLYLNFVELFPSIYTVYLGSFRLGSIIEHSNGQVNVDVQIQGHQILFTFVDNKEEAIKIVKDFVNDFLILINTQPC